MRKLFLLLGIFWSGCYPLTVRADSIKLLAHGNQSLAALTQMVTQAKTSIDMVYYIFKPCDTTSNYLMKLLAAKARQHVQVRVLLDAYQLSGEQKEGIAAYFAQNGVELRYYNDAFPISPDINFRSHIKFTLVDHSSYLSGGRNINDGYFGISDVLNYVDRDLLVSGNSARQVLRSFEELWGSSMVSAPAPATRNPADFLNRCLHVTAKEIALHRYLQSQTLPVLREIPTRTCNNVQFVTDDPLFFVSSFAGKRTTNAYLSFMAGTKRSLEIENWSYIPTELLEQQFVNLRSRLIPVQVMTNGAADAGNGLDEGFDAIMAYYAKRDTVGEQAVLQLAPFGKLQDRWKLSAARSQWMIHAKTSVRDRQDVLVGSFNIDPRSYHTNLESAVIVRGCSALANDLVEQTHALKKIFVHDLKCESCQAPNQRSWMVQVLAWLAFDLL